MIVLDRRRRPRWPALAWALLAAVVAAATVVLASALAARGLGSVAALVVVLGGSAYLSAQRTAFDLADERRTVRARVPARPVPRADEAPTALMPAIRTEVVAR